MRRKLLFYGLLGAATVGLSRLFAACRSFAAAPGVETGASVIGFGAAVLGAMLWLGFVLYEVDRAAGRVRRRIAPYEWILSRRAAAQRPDLAWTASGHGRPGGRR
jgi:hypothetical protein